MEPRLPQNGMSHLIGRTDLPLLEMTIPEALAETVARVPDHEAAVFAAEGIRWSYAEFAR
jgi:fatty-acyl-CoA synthase